MKKSKLRKIIRESIKELMTEQWGGNVIYPNGWSYPTLIGSPVCDGKIYLGQIGVDIQTFPGWASHGFPQMIVDHGGPTANWDDYVFKSSSSGAISGYEKIKWIHDSGWNIQFTNFKDMVDYANNQGITLLPQHGGGTPTYSTIVYHVRQALGLNNMLSNTCSPGPYTLSSSGVISGCTDPNAFNYNPNATQNQGCDYGFNCKQIGDHPKFGSKCVPGTSQNIGQFATQQDCIESGCEGLSPDKSKDIQQPFSPLTTDPQDMVKPEDDEITRMQDLAKISKK